MLSEVAEAFAWYYEDRKKQGLPAEKKNCIFTKGGYSAKDVERLILSMPFKRFDRCRSNALRVWDICVIQSISVSFRLTRVL